MINFKVLYLENIVCLKIPAPWLISKNNILDLRDFNLEVLDSDELFELKSCFFEYDIFSSRYYNPDSKFELNIVVFYLSDIISINGQYEICCILFNKKKEIFNSSVIYDSLEKTIEALNSLHLNIIFEIDNILQNKDYQKINNFLT